MEFKAKDWVLVRDDNEEPWRLNIFSHKEDDECFVCVSRWYAECIPYEGNEALLGKTDKPEEKHVWHAGDRVDVLSDFDDMWHPGFIIEIDYTRSADGFHYRVESECFKSMTGKVWCKADQLREPEKKDENGWRPKEGDTIEVQIGDKWESAVLIEDDLSSIPFRVRLQNGERVWRPEDMVRPASPYKFGDRVEVNFDGDWREAVIIEIDTSSIPYKVATPDGEIHWRRRGDVRRA